MHRPAKPPPKPRRPVGDAVPVTRDPEEPPPSAPAAALVLRLPGESREESLARVRAEIARRTGKPRSGEPIAIGPFAVRQHTATAQLRAWEASGASVVWQGPDGVEAGTWRAAPECAYPIRTDRGELSPSALRLVGRWLEACAEARAAERRAA